MGDVHAQSVTARLRAAEDLMTVQEIVRTRARVLTHADGATFVLRDVDHCFYADEDAISPLWKGQRFPLATCISGWAMLHAQSVVIPDITQDDRIPIESYRPTFVRSLAMVPVGEGKPVAAIGAYWARHHTATAGEVAGLEGLAAAVGEAIRRIGLFGSVSMSALSRPDNSAESGPVDRLPTTLAASEDHERIARDLHDTVLQRMFALGLRLQGLRGTVDDPRAADAIDDAVSQVDESIRELRGVIFGLEYGHERLGGLPGEILAVAAEAGRTLGFKPDVVIDGPLDQVGDGLRHDIIGALREMLSNVARHARASRVKVECFAGPPLQVRVTDDGAGPPTRSVIGNGMRNLTARAGLLGGSFELSRAAHGGTAAIWSVPAR